MKKVNFKFLAFLVFLMVGNAFNTKAQNYFTINNLYNLSTYQNVYDFKDAVNQYGYTSDELQGTYKDSFGNSISITKGMHSSKNYVSYYVPMTKNNLLTLQNDLKEDAYFTGNSKDGKSQYYSSPNGRFDIIISKDNMKLHYNVEENDKASYNHFSEAIRISANKLKINSYTNYTLIDVKKGDKIYMHASGSVKTGKYSDFTGPIGKPRPEGKNWEAVSSMANYINFGALMVGVNEYSYSSILPLWKATGEEMMYVAPNAGKLCITINDKDGSDNEGAFEVEYSINVPLKTSANIQVSVPKNETPATPAVVAPLKITPPAPAYDLKANLPRRFSGTITNTTVNRTSGSVMSISQNSDGTYHLKGNADNVNLTGTWEVDGWEVMDKGQKKYQFTGNIELDVSVTDKYGSEYLKKIKTPFSMLVSIDENGMKGSYQIAAYREYNGIQNGTIDLDMSTPILQNSTNGTAAAPRYTPAPNYRANTDAGNGEYKYNRPNAQNTLNNTPSVETKYDIKNHLPRTFNGSITNTTENRTGNYALLLERLSNGTYYLSSTTDNINLTGRWYLKGKEEADGTIKFEGLLGFNYVDTHFPKGTKATIKTEVKATENGMTGKYEISPYYNFTYTQYGTIDLH